MKEHDIKARGKRKFIVTTDSKHSLPIAPNLLNRNFQPDAPNRVWTSDITYIQTDAGWLYLAVVLDLYSRQIVGWSMQSHMQSSLVTDALKMAWFRRRPEPGLIFHSDRGSQYCSHVFQNILAEYGMHSSMSRKANCWDNAPTESLWGSLKAGRLYGMRFETLTLPCKNDQKGFSSKANRRMKLREMLIYCASERSAIFAVNRPISDLLWWVILPSTDAPS